MKIEELFGTLQQSMVETWRSHLKTSKYSEHIALDEYYSEIVDKVDALIENWMGTHDKIEEYINLLDAEEYDSALVYLENLRDIVIEGRELMDSSELESNVDDILGLIDRTLYKLRELTESKVTSLSTFAKIMLSINEEKKSVFAEIESATYNWIDYMYNEGVVNYDDKHLVDYSKGNSKPDFNDIVKGILDEYSEEDGFDNTTSIVLKKYLKDGGPKDGKQSAVENAILSAISNFAKDGNCENLC